LAESWTFALWKLMAVCWRPCFIDLTIILQWCVFALGRALRSLFPILVNFWMLLAVERAYFGGSGCMGRWHFTKVIQTSNKLVMIVRLLCKQ
jgi:predicted Abi (CAAX) family protease